MKHAIDSRKSHPLLEHINSNEAASHVRMIKLLQEVLANRDIGYLRARGVAPPRYRNFGTDGWLQRVGDP